MENELSKLCNKNKIILQRINEDGSFKLEYYKSMLELSKQLDMPYSTLTNIYYTCINKGGGKEKKQQKKFCQYKYVALLKKIRIFDYLHTDLMHNVDYFNNLIQRN